jgi:WD40 repeat protein
MLRVLGLMSLVLCWLLVPLPAPAQKPPRDNIARTDCYGDPLPEGALARLGTVRLRYRSAVYSVIFTPDGKSVIASDSRDGVVSEDNSICISEASTGRLVRHFQGHRYGSEHLVLSPDGKTLAGIGCAATIWLWDLATGRLLRELGPDREGNFIGLAFFPDGKTLASIGVDSGIQLWDPATGKRIRRLEGEKHGWAIACSPDGQFLATGGEEALQLWDVGAGQKVWQTKAPEKGISAVTFSPDGKTLAAGDHTGTVHLVAPADGKEARRWAAHPRGAREAAYFRGVNALAWSPGGKVFASAGDDGLIALWDFQTGKKIRTLHGHRSAVYAVAFSSDGRRLASGSLDQSVRLWDLSTGREGPAFGGHQDLVTCVAFAPDGQALASGGLDGTIRLWDPARAEQRWLLQAHRNEVEAVAFSPDGKLLASSDPSWEVRLWEAATGKGFQSLAGHGGHVIAFHPEGRVLASARADGTVPVWDTATGKERLCLTPKAGPAGGAFIAFSPDGKLLACGGRKVIHLWDWAAGREVRRLLAEPKEGFESMAFAPDGHTLVSGGDEGTVRQWRVADGKILAEHQLGFLRFRQVAFSPDGRLLALSGEQDPVVSLWEVATWQEVHRLVGHRDEASCLAFAPDGRRLASGSRDFTVLVWDIAPAPGREAEARVDVERCWRDLAGGDARAAYRAVWGLVRVPGRSVPLLREKLRPAPAGPPRRIDRLVADLDSDSFTTRRDATAALEGLGEVAEPALRQALRDPPSAEVGRRVKRLLSKLDAPVPPSERLRWPRALTVLEQVGTPEARGVLEMLAKGAPEARLTQEAKAALARLAKRAAGRR